MKPDTPGSPKNRALKTVSCSTKTLPAFSLNTFFSTFHSHVPASQQIVVKNRRLPKMLIVSSILSPAQQGAQGKDWKLQQKEQPDAEMHDKCI
jgi:hypothetical protein